MRTFLRQGLVALAAVTLFLPIAIYQGIPAQAASITISGCDSIATPVSDGNGGFTLTCTSTAPSGAPSSCALTASPTSLSAAGSVALAMNCTGGNPATSYTWTSNTSVTNFSTATTTGSQNPGITTSTTFTAYAGNASGNGPTKSVIVSVGGGGGGGGGGSIDTTACTALGLNAKVVVANWSSNTIVYTAPSPVNGFGPNDALIVQFTTSSVTTSTSKGNISGVEYNGPTTMRAGALSASPCDFTVGMPKYKLKSGVVTQCATTVVSGATSPSIGFSLAAQPQSSLDCFAVLQPNTTYYLNLTNFAPPPPTGTEQCSQSVCNMQITLTKPVGT